MEEKITKLINQIEDDIICYRDIIDIVDNSKCLNGSEFDHMADLMSRGLEDLKRERIEDFMNDYGNPLDGVIEKSFVLEKNGHKYAIIGLAPPDLHERIRDNDSRKQIGVDDFEKTNAQLYQITNTRSYKLALKFNSLFSFLQLHYIFVPYLFGR